MSSHLEEKYFHQLNRELSEKLRKEEEEKKEYANNHPPCPFCKQTATMTVHPSEQATTTRILVCDSCGCVAGQPSDVLVEICKKNKP